FDNRSPKTHIHDANVSSILVSQNPIDCCQNIADVTGAVAGENSQVIERCSRRYSAIEHAASVGLKSIAASDSSNVAAVSETVGYGLVVGEVSSRVYSVVANLHLLVVVPDARSVEICSRRNSGIDNCDSDTAAVITGLERVIPRISLVCASSFFYMAGSSAG